MLRRFIFSIIALTLSTPVFAGTVGVRHYRWVENTPRVSPEFIGPVKPVMLFQSVIPVTCSGVADDDAIENAYTNIAVDGDTITAGAGTCVWASTAILGSTETTAKTVTVQGSGTLATTIQYGSGAAEEAFRMWSSPNKFLRVTNFLFERTGGGALSASQGVIKILGVNTSSSNVRVDHNRFNNVKGNVLNFNAAVLFDNNLVVMTQVGYGNVIYARNGEDCCTAGVNKGWLSGSRGLHLGEDDGAVIESNKFIGCVTDIDPALAGAVCVAPFPIGDVKFSDGEFGSRWTKRFNELHNISTSVMHGTEGANRGHIKHEIYRNVVHLYAGGSSGRGYHLRSGNGVIWGDTFIYHGAASIHFGGTYTTYRWEGAATPYDQAPANGTAWSPGCVAWGPYDLAVGATQEITGFHTGTTPNSVTLEDNTKNFLSYAPTGRALLRAGVVQLNSASPQYKFNSPIYAYTATTISTVKDHDTPNGVCAALDGQICWNEGDAYLIKFGLNEAVRNICVDQAGWAPADDITVLQSRPSGSIILPFPNPEFAPSGWPGLVRTPSYGWLNTINGTVMPLLDDISKSSREGPAMTISNIIREGDPDWPADIYNQPDASNPDAACTQLTGSPQTCGVRVGLIVNLPAECTLGVAYWATNEGEWDSTNGATPDGQLYRCEYVTPTHVNSPLTGSGATTWRLHYTPFTYPHPRASGGEDPPPDTTPPVPGNSGTITTASVTQSTMTLNWTKATDAVTAQALLSYKVYRSLANNLGSVANVEANGTLLTTALDIATYDVTGLTQGTTYYFNVLVTDGAGNKAIYTTKSETTTAVDAVAPTPGNSGTITVAALSHTQTNAARPNGSSTTVAHTLTSSVVAASLIICTATIGHDTQIPTQTINSVSDNLNGTYAPFGTVLEGKDTDGSGFKKAQFYKANALAGSTTATATFSATSVRRGLICSSYPGIVSEAPLAVTAGQSQINTGTGANAVTSGNTATPAEAGSLIYAVTLGRQVPFAPITITAGTGYTERYNAQAHSDDTVVVGDKVLASTGVVAGTFTAGSAGADTLTQVSAWTVSVTASSVQISWTKGTDNVSAAATLQYQVCQSLAADIETVSTCEAKAISSYTADIATYKATGLDDNTTYRFNVVIKDEAGNKALYTAVEQETTGDELPPHPGNDGLLVVENVTNGSALLTWTPANDDVTPSASLQYEVRRSLSDNMSSVANAEANGTIALAYAADTEQLDISGLKARTTYYFTVIVKDAAGNKAVYGTTSFTTRNPRRGLFGIFR